MTPSLDFAVSSLLCSEDNDSICYDDNDDDSTRFDQNINLNQDQNQTLIRNLETEYPVVDLPLQNDECLSSLIVKESQQFMGALYYLNKLKNDNLFLDARQDAVDWIFKVHAQLNFGPLCAYLSVNYLDRFLTVYELPRDKPWMMQLLAVTCLSLAAKMEETEIPLILDFQAAETRFLFEPKTIQRMELVVLSTLEWRMQPVTPFSFIDSFIWKLNDDDQSQYDSRSLILKSTQLILSLIKGIDFLKFQPSEIAAAVAIAAVGNRVEKARLYAIFEHAKKERVVKCMEIVIQGLSHELLEWYSDIFA